MTRDTEKVDPDAAQDAAQDGWETFELAELLRQKSEMSFPYLEFIRSPSLSCGLYKLAAGAKDLQGPHDEDEIYFVVDGRASLLIGGEQRQVQRGSIVFVRSTSEHRFVEIQEDITLLVFFGGTGGSL